MKVRIKKALKNDQFMEKDRNGNIDWGTMLPKSIGRQNKPNDDGLIRDSRGQVLK